MRADLQAGDFMEQECLQRGAVFEAASANQNFITEKVDNRQLFALKEAKTADRQILRLFQSDTEQTFTIVERIVADLPQNRRLADDRSETRLVGESEASYACDVRGDDEFAFNLFEGQ